MVATTGVGKGGGKGKGDIVASIHDGPQATAARTRLFGWYQMAGYFSTAFGAWIAGFVVDLLRNQFGFGQLESLRCIIVAYAAAGLGLAIVFSFLSSSIEYKPPEPHPEPPEETPIEDDADGGDLDVAPGQENQNEEPSESSPLVAKKKHVPPPMPPELKRLVGRLSLLFSIDSFAGSLMTGTLLAYWFDLRFAMPLSSLGALISGSQVIAGISTLLAPLVAERIGLIKTMVFTHLPSNVLVAALPFAPNPAAAAALLFARFSISQMDTVPRASFQAQIAPPEHRTAILGTFNVVRSLAGAAAPAVSGWFFGRGMGDWSLYLCGALKIVYDLWLLAEFGSAG